MDIEREGGREGERERDVGVGGRMSGKVGKKEKKNKKWAPQFGGWDEGEI
jgi:hypothetical protein